MSEEETEQEKNINKEKYDKYREMFDKHKNEEGLISEEGVNEILNECGRKTTLKESEELIKKITRDSESTTINFDNFVKLMNTENIDNIDENKNENKPKKLSNLQIYGFMLLFLTTGSINTIANKLQQNTTSKGVKYKGHQKFITFCMFNGEFLCLLFYWIKEGRYNKKKKAEALFLNLVEKVDDKDKKKGPKIWYFLFPALFDILSSSISSIGLTFLASSIYQMFRGATIIFTCIASIIILKQKYYRHHFLGIVIVIIGLLIVGLNATIYGNSSSGENPSFGIFLVALSQVFSCFLYITEEKLLKGYEVPPLKAVGLEGMWGVCVYIILLFIFYFIRCEKWPDFLKDGVCIRDKEDENDKECTIRFENPIFAVQQIMSNSNLKIYLSLYICSIAFFNLAGLTISKNVSSTARTIVDTLRTIVIWTFFLTVPFVPEDTKEEFSWLQLLGFAVLILGSIIYNEILVLNFCGFGDNTKEAIKRREKRAILEKEIQEKSQDNNDKKNETNPNIEE